jgi:circadian clock protein KaiC
LPVTSLKLNRAVSSERISTGMPTLDEMFGGNGFYRGSSILVSGMAGTGKTSLAAYFVNEACKRNEKAIYFAFEESPPQIIRNMKSIGLNLDPHVKKRIVTISFGTSCFAWT